MSLLPARFLINDAMPVSGKVVKPVEPMKFDAIREFEIHSFDVLWATPFDYELITEADCQQKQAIPSQPKADAEGWVAIDSRTDELPEGWGKEFFDLRCMSMGKPIEHMRQLSGMRGTNTFYVAAYRRSSLVK
jgi:hypothetical protein